jgi:deoxyribodipyrimidine photo-lyase
MSTVLWFQRDLRIENNPALDWAIARNRPIIAVYIHSPDEDMPWAPGAASSWWLYHSLEKLRSGLAARNIKLFFFKANSVESIPAIAQLSNANVVSWTNRHEPSRRECESRIEKQLQKDGVKVKRFRDEILHHPESFLTESQNTPYKVFTPFYKRLRRELDLTSITLSTSDPEWRSPDANHSFHDAVELEQLGLLDHHPWHHKLHRYWVPGESNAHERLDHFLDDALEEYGEKRDFPSIEGTSSLSPYLHFGEISPSHILNALAPLIEFGDSNSAKAAESFFRQLVWREFARYILHHFPQTTNEPMNRKFTQSFWKNDSDKLEHWQRGETGIPIVDAGMQQLWETGWMHNRVRMLVASLLTKNLGIAWQDGARWFWDTLVDADLANNSMGWQWVAGCGVDAAPYFRVFNPYTQAERFDPEHRYIKRWNKISQENEPRLPMVDVASSRNSALEKYNRLIRTQ